MPTRNTVRIAWLAAGGTLTALTVAFTTLAALAEINEPRPTAVAEPHPAAETTSTSHPLTSPKIVVRVTGHADLWVVPGPGKRLDIRRELLWTRNRPVVTERWDGRTLTIDARCPDGTDCRAQYVLGLPAATGVEASIRSGTLSVDDIQGDLRLSADTGDVNVRGSRGVLRARVREGSVTGDDLRSAGSDVETGHGHVTLRFRNPPADVRAVVRTAGDVEVRVPDDGGRGYDVRTASGDARSPSGDVRTVSGDVTVAVRIAPGAPHRITALTPAGELRVLPF